jgi:hypothetical protein
VLIPLPLGLFALGAAHVAEANRELLGALIRYVGYFYLAGLGGGNRADGGSVDRVPQGALAGTK